MKYTLDSGYSRTDGVWRIVGKTNDTYYVLRSMLASRKAQVRILFLPGHNSSAVARLDAQGVLVAQQNLSLADALAMEVMLAHARKEGLIPLP